MASRGHFAYFAHQSAGDFLGQDGESSYVNTFLKVKVLDCLKYLFVTCICKLK